MAGGWGLAKTNADLRRRGVAPNAGSEHPSEQPRSWEGLRTYDPEACWVSGWVFFSLGPGGVKVETATLPMKNLHVRLLIDSV